MFKSCALVLRDMIALRGAETADQVQRGHERQVHYLSLEFLMGRSLMKNAYNLGVLGAMNGAIEKMGFKPADIEQVMLELHEVFDYTTPEEAAAYYERSPY